MGGNIDPAVAGSTAIFPAKTTAEIARATTMMARGVCESRFMRPRLNLRRRRVIGNNDMTVNQTRENLKNDGCQGTKVDS